MLVAKRTHQNGEVFVNQETHNQFKVYMVTKWSNPGSGTRFDNYDKAINWMNSLFESLCKM